MITKVLQRPTLVLNRNWQPVNVATVARALVLLWNESARVVDPADYQLYTWADWSKLQPRDGETVHPGGAVPAAGAGGGRADRLRPAAGGPRDLQPPEHLQAGPLHLPILRCPAGQRGTDAGPRGAAFAGWCVELGELRAGLHGLQQAEGRPDAGAGADAAAQAAGPADVEAALRGPQRADRKLVEVHQRSVLERDAARVVVTPRPPVARPGADTGVCSWESRRSPKPPTGFESSHSCFADVAEQQGGGPVNRIMLVQIQSSALVCMSRWCSGSHGPSEGPGPGSTPGRDTSRCADRIGPAKVVPDRALADALRVYRMHGSSNCRRVRFLGGALKRYVLGVWRIRTRPCEGRRPGSTPGEDTEQPDAGARRHGDRLQPGSSGFDSHRRLFGSNDTAGPTAHAAPSSNEAVGGVCSVNGF